MPDANMLREQVLGSAYSSTHSPQSPSPSVRAGRNSTPRSFRPVNPPINIRTTVPESNQNRNFFGIVCIVLAVMFVGLPIFTVAASILLATKPSMNRANDKQADLTPVVTVQKPPERIGIKPPVIMDRNKSPRTDMPTSSTAKQVLPLCRQAIEEMGMSSSLSAIKIDSMSKKLGMERQSNGNYQVKGISLSPEEGKYLLEICLEDSKRYWQSFNNEFKR